MRKNDLFAFSGLNKKELEIINLLKNGAVMRPADLARNCSVKRTTINYILKKLAHRGVVQKIKIRGHYEWTTADYKKIAHRIDALYGFYGALNIGGIIKIPAKIGIEVLAGRENIRKIYQLIAASYNGQRIYQIQGIKAASSIRKFGHEALNELQEQLEKSGAILEGMIGWSTLSQLKEIPTTLLKKYINRPVVAYVVDNRFINFDMDIILHKDAVFLFDFQKELVIIINNEQIKTAIFSLYESLKVSAEKIDLNKYIHQIIEDRK